jgi:hypothetical protein
MPSKLYFPGLRPPATAPRHSPPSRLPGPRRVASGAMRGPSGNAVGRAEPVPAQGVEPETLRLGWRRAQRAANSSHHVTTRCQLVSPRGETSGETSWQRVVLYANTRPAGAGKARGRATGGAVVRRPARPEGSKGSLGCDITPLGPGRGSVTARAGRGGSPPAPLSRTRRRPRCALPRAAARARDLVRRQHRHQAQDRGREPEVQPPAYGQLPARTGGSVQAAAAAGEQRAGGVG